MPRNTNSPVSKQLAGLSLSVKIRTIAMSKRRTAGDIIYKQPFPGSRAQGAFGVVQPEDTDDQMPCMLDCGDTDCVEWINVWLFQGDTREDAEQAIEDDRYTGAAYHVSECRMADDKPVSDS